MTLSPRLLSALAQLLGVVPTELRLCQASVRAKDGERRPEAERPGSSRGRQAGEGDAPAGLARHQIRVREHRLQHETLR